jgi:thiol-disulfide isomerase/thioredoxin
VTTAPSSGSQAPGFKPGLDWINTAGPIQLDELSGRVVLLDFWTYGCINCRHVQPRLGELERRFPDVLTVIGVHSGKFAHERETANLAAACQRQGVAHPVVNDRQFRVWRAYGVQAWPTIALVSPEGMLLGVQPGEFPLETVAEAIHRGVTDAESRGTLARGPERFTVLQPPTGGFLRFPGRALVAGERLLVSDTGHGRVLDCVLDSRDPSAPAATVRAEHGGFLEPQGIVVLGDDVFVADRAEHSVWRLAAGGDRERVAGTGELGEQMPAAGLGPHLALRSPLGLAAQGGELVISMAGSHQIWRLDVATLKLRAWAGTGREELVDDRLDRALLAQPTGVAAFGSRVAFADAESSAVRIADEAVGVRTVVGKGLFEFGDRDGSGDRVLLQHAEDLAVHEGMLAVADTYNDRLKRIDPVSRQSQPWPGLVGEPKILREPAGVSSDGTRLAVADTGNHRVVLVSPDGTPAEVRFA